MPPRARTTADPAESGEEQSTRKRRWTAPRTICATDPFAPGSTAMYRFRNSVGALLYVGISDHPKRRFGQHFDDKPWWGEVAGWDVEWFASRAIAEAEELRVIRDEVPAFNIRDVPAGDAAVDFHGLWMSHFRTRRPTRHDLNQLYLSMEQIHSLRRWPDARLPFDTDTAVELLQWARGQARLTERWPHHQFVAKWMREHAADINAGLPDWTTSDSVPLRWLTATIWPTHRGPSLEKEQADIAFRPPLSVRSPARVDVETTAGTDGLLCARTQIPVHECDCSSRHIVSELEERKFGLPVGAPFGAKARPWRRPVKQRAVDALRRYVA